MAKMRQDYDRTDENGLLRQGELVHRRFPCRWKFADMRKAALGPDIPSSQFTSPQPEGTCPEIDPTLSVHTHTATGDPVLFFPNGKASLSGIEQDGGGVTIVVVGVTPHQGARENRVQGEGSQVLFLKACHRRRC